MHMKNGAGHIWSNFPSSFIEYTLKNKTKDDEQLNITL